MSGLIFPDAPCHPARKIALHIVVLRTVASRPCLSTGGSSCRLLRHRYGAHRPIALWHALSAFPSRFSESLGDHLRAEIASAGSCESTKRAYLRRE